MKNAYLLFVLGGFLACNRAEKTSNQAVPSTTTIASDSATTHVAKPQPCQSVVATGKLGKSDTYQESAKSLQVIVTLDQDTSQVTTPAGCFSNNAVTILATKKSGNRVFKRTLTKDDLLYFIKTDDVVTRSVLRNVLYKPTFNGQKYVTITMQLIDPANQRKTDYTLFMNYFGEILKVR